ncbi:hypothetical protein LENED_003052 [Lentinula edodes]|uniref:Uncharacterized protein n=1 Tax=Lentinula edodes TaxID=5353 RepID=A0A1Q3E2I3_LENED|nr:hypothetical protein LENED_003052 [Lentinula edodes]
MKARLRTGQPIGQYLKPTQRHGALYLCTCASCGVEGSLVITADGQQTAGRYFYSFLDVSKHWREQENAERLMNNIGVLTSNHTLPIPHSAAVPISTVLETPATFLDIPRASTIACVPVLPVSDDDGEAEAKPSSNVSFEWQEVIATRARLNRAIEHAGWDPTDVDFIGETTVDLPEISDPIQLLAASSANSYVEGHLEWLFRTIQEIRGYSDSLPCFKETRFRLEHQLVCHMLEQELTSTRQKLRDEWKRRVQIFELGQERIQSSGAYYCIATRDFTC